MKNVPRSTLVGLGLVALATLLLEVNLTRIFAVTLWYYFGVLAIALALLGTAAAGILCFVRPETFVSDDHPRHLVRFAIAFAILAPVSIAVHLNTSFARIALGSPAFIAQFVAQLVLLFAAFFCAGMCITIILFRYTEKIGAVYFVDLAGASIGSLLVVALLTQWSAPAITFAVAGTASLAAFSFSLQTGKRRTSGVAALLVVGFFALFFVNDRTGILGVRAVKSYGTTMQAEEEGAIFEQWSPVSRVAVFPPEQWWFGERMLVTNDAGAPTSLVRYDGDPSTLGRLKADSREVVHRLRQNGNALIIGSGGGSDVLAALAYGQRKITAVEINPVIASLVTKHFAKYTGNIFHDPRVTLHVQEGRNFAAGSRDRYDVIQITMIDSWVGAAAGAFLFNENSLYTLEAVRDYYRHLTDDGIFSMTRYYHWDEALRLTNMFADFLATEGIHDPENRMAIVLEEREAYRRATVLLKKGTFTPAESTTLLNAARADGFSVIYAPHLPDAALEPSGYSALFRSMLAPSRSGGHAREEIVRSYRRDLRSPTDNRPFFFFMTRFRDSLRADLNDHPARRIALPLLYTTFFGLTIVAILTVLLPLYLSGKATLRAVPHRARSIAYFACLGVGFMLIEISLIQRLTVFLGHPTYSFVVVLATLLAASGVGSLVSGIWSPEPSKQKLILVLGAIVAIVLINVFFVYDAFIGLMALAKPARIALSIAAIVPPGFLLGMCFPMGIQIVRRYHEHLVPWGWAVNGVFSVFASIFSLVLALNLGFKAMLSAGAACYLLAAAIVYSMRTTPEDATASARRSEGAVDPAETM